MKFPGVTILLCCSMAQAQSTAATNKPALHTESAVVLVPALVRDASGKPVYMLKAGDFRVTDDGVEQQLTLDENTSGEPLALTVVVQTGGAGARKLAAYRGLAGALSALAGSMPHQVALVGFDSSPQVIVPFTPNVDAVAAALQDLEPGDGHAAILDALAYSVYLLRSAPAGYRRAILLFSETIDHDSKTRLQEALRSISDTNTAIYVAAFSSVKSYAGYQAAEIMNDTVPGPAHGCFAKDPNAEADEVSSNRWMQTFDCLGLLAPPLRAAKLAVLSAAYGMQRKTAQTVADLTGGEFYRFEDQRGLARDLIALSNHLPNRYMLSFRPQAPHAGFHAVELRLKDYPTLKVSARSGYWVDEETAAAAQ
jgi:VWFA-related protein